jgi:regulator of sigma E protease
MERFEDVVAYVRSRAGEPLSFEVERSGHSLVLPLVPEAALSPVMPQKGKMVGRLGIYGREIVKKDLNFFQAMAVAGQELVMISWQTLKGITRMILGQISLDGMGGPLMIAQLSGEIAQVGMGALLSFMAVLSINLGLINLFPIPLLDGGHIFLYGIEAVRGNPLSEKALHFCYRIGLWIVLGLFVLSTWNDLNRLRIFQWVGNFLGF